MAELNPSRLIVARKRRGLTKRALADRAAISTRSLSAYEAGTQEPNSQTRRRLADVLAFPLSFFEGSDLEEPSLDATSFRALTRLTARRRDQACSSATLALALADWLDTRFKLPEPDLPQLRGVDPDTAADAVRKSWGLGESPIANMVHLLEAHGVRVFSLAEECADVDAFSFWRDGVPYMFLNTLKSAERSRMDAAHELGHLTLHWGHETPRGREAEHQAQAFGSAFLMPRGSVLAKAPRTARVDHLIKAKGYWKVAVANLAYRMHKLGLLTEWQYRSLFIEIGEKGYRRNEPRSIDRETSQVLSKALGTLRAEGMTKGDIAEALGLPTEELNKVIFGLVLTPLDGRGDPGSFESGGRQPDLHLVPHRHTENESR